MAEKTNWRIPISVVVVILSLVFVSFCVRILISLSGNTIKIGSNWMPTLEHVGTQTFHSIVYPGLSAAYVESFDEVPHGLGIEPQGLAAIEVIFISDDGSTWKLSQATTNSFKTWKSSHNFEKVDNYYTNQGVILYFKPDGSCLRAGITGRTNFKIQIVAKSGAIVEWPCSSAELRAALGPPISENRSRAKTGSP